ncbi:hypothetical protein [Spirosoma areae]
MVRLLFYFLCFWFSQTPLKAQSQLDWLLKQSEFKPILVNHLKEIDEGRKGGFPIVSVLLFKPNADTLTIYLTSYGYLIEAKEHLPASFMTIENHPFLIYDGSELLIEDKQKWFERVRSFIGKQLCDDLEYRELLKQPGPKELRVPCGFIYDAPIEKLTFVGARLFKRKLAGSVPYYLK